MRTSWRKKLLLLCATLAATVALAEVALRIADKHRPPPTDPVGRLPELFRGVETYGYSLWPSRTWVMDYPAQVAPDSKARPRPISLRSNSHGFRDERELRDKDQRRRILFAGDSFTYGQGVQVAERFTDLVEQAKPAWRIANVAMPGWGPDLMLMAVEAVIAVAQPDVVAFVYTSDMFRRVRPHYLGMGFPIPRLVNDEGVLRAIPHPEVRPWEQLYVYQAVTHILDPSTRPFAGLTDAEWLLHEMILDKLVALGREHDFDPVLVHLAGKWTSDKQRAWMAEYAGRHELLFIDVTDPILSADPDAVYIPDNSHYGPGGHRIAADVLVRRLPETRRLR